MSNTTTDTGNTGRTAGFGDVQLSVARRLSQRARFLVRGIGEYVMFDARILQRVLAGLGLIVGLVFLITGRRSKALHAFAALHRVNWSPAADRLVEALFRREMAKLRSAESRRTSPLATHIDALLPSPRTQKFFDNPQRLLGTRVVVLKSPAKNERGVILIDYSFAFPTVAKLFDLNQIARRYYIVLEPSWSGYCDFDILCYGLVDSPVFVEAYEPRDSDLVSSLGSNLVPVGVAANWWVDHRIMRPLPGVAKDRDVIMIASWGRFKRHASFFAALAELKRRGHRLSGTLIGYPTDCQMADVAREAAYFGVLDQLELREWLTPEEVNHYLNRSKINVIWSRREGVNRVIIEGMCANVPCILRQGFNYGYRYPYVNSATGRFATEATLPDTIIELLDTHGGCRPRDWVMEHMTCQKGTEIIGTAVRDLARGLGEAWTSEPVVRVCELNANRYWNEEDRSRFAKDYEYLSSLARPPRRSATQASK